MHRPAAKIAVSAFITALLLVSLFEAGHHCLCECYSGAGSVCKKAVWQIPVADRVASEGYSPPPLQEFLLKPVPVKSLAGTVAAITSRNRAPPL